MADIGSNVATVNPNPGNSEKITKAHWLALLSTFLGWGMDFFDLMIYSYVIKYILVDFHLNTAAAGIIAAGALVASAFGGVVFGFVADRVGRKRSLMISIIIYAVATGLCGFSTNMIMLLIFRILVGLGIGGEWSTGMSLIGETWPAKYRTIIITVVQSASSFGLLAAVFVSSIVLGNNISWRVVFFIGVAPALVALLVRKSVKETDAWSNSEKNSVSQIASKVVKGPYAKNVLIATLFATLGMIVYWGVFTWLPTYLTLPVSMGGRGMSIIKSATFMYSEIAGGLIGTYLFGIIAKKIGPKFTFPIYIFGLGVMIPIFIFFSTTSTIFIIAFFLGMFSGYYPVFGMLFYGMFPPEIRATAQGVAYNIGRGVSGAAPICIGAAAMALGMGMALATVTGMCVLTIIFTLMYLISGRIK
jgi:predicted MFS family arabinose efflux permease